MSDFEGVADTLYIPLSARIYVSKRFPNYFFDEKSLELESKIPNDIITKNSSEYTMMASVARYYNFDEMITNYINSHGKCNIINLGAGLETAYFRIDRKNAVFYEMDLPEVINLRKELLGENDGEILIPGDLFDLKWTKDIDTTLPSLITVSGVFQYFHENEILKFINDLKKEFVDVELIFDATSKGGLKFTNRYVKKTGNDSALMYFYVNNCKEFASKSNTILIEERTFYPKTLKMLSKELSFMTKLFMKIADSRKNAIILHLKLK
ncbi:MAG: class I SAM-dependent methyltransferase [Methanobrevibacter millerae]|uniref:Class I SAM-dependent methyltransferase n=1 Tax=Methanobrevibacter millerae TaxID=230361 RepID=A0A8T3VRA6_9EURY|nr:class I SAM-dependent methyltransferase [Methanobrevibacter millerae]